MRFQNIRQKSTTMLLLGLLSFGSLAHAAESAVVAKSGTATLRREDLQALLATLPPETRRAALADDATLEQLLRSELLRSALVAKARAAGLEKDAAVKIALDRARDELVVRVLVEQQVKLPAGYPAEADIKAAYAAGVAAAAKVAEYHLAQVFVALPDGAPADKETSGLAKVGAVQGRLQKADFAQLAKEFSEHADSAGKGGDLGFLDESRLLPEVRAALVDAKPGSLIGPVKTAQGVHFFKLLERRAVAVPALETLHDQIAEALRQQQRSIVAKAYLEQAAREAGITVNQIELSQFRTEAAK
jgi:peptidylprolyl isomerase